MSALKETLVDIINEDIAEADDDVLSDVRYIRKSAALIVDALQKGYDVMQMPNGEVLTTGMETVVYRYGWDKDKARLVKSKVNNEKLEVPSTEGVLGAVSTGASSIAVLQNTLADVLNEDQGDDDEIFSDARYARKSATLIVDALQKGYDVMQMPSGDIITTGMETVVYRYMWDKDKARLVKGKIVTEKLEVPSADVAPAAPVAPVTAAKQPKKVPTDA